MLGLEYRKSYIELNNLSLRIPPKFTLSFLPLSHTFREYSPLKSWQRRPRGFSTLPTHR